MRVIPGSNRYTIRANWKLLAENSIDAYHALPTHQTYFDYMANEVGGGSSGIHNRKGFGRSLGKGHGVMENDAVYGRPIAMWHPYFGEEARAEIQRHQGRSHRSLWTRQGPADVRKEPQHGHIPQLGH